MIIPRMASLTADMYKLATAFGTDMLFDAKLATRRGALGDVQPGASTDLLRVDGDPLANIELIADRRTASS
jgi:hypothetical protein